MKLKNYDKYIYAKNLTASQIRNVALVPLYSLAYDIANCTDYDHVHQMLVRCRNTYGRLIHFKIIRYILNRSGLTRFQKFKLKIRYLLL